ncbi:MAG TPA: pyridoxamine 5'-phosphate oxidase family protein [Desulfobacteraceae bacterium]|nr:pyridoxamine 5'-phosphate oxidase family protein [Desulfobacteraceae bacterium]
MEDLKAYFEKKKGLGVLSTSDADGRVDAAVYSRPHFMDDNTVAFIMRERLTRHNLQSNPHAAFLFVEELPGYSGKRLYLTKVREEENSELIDSLSRRQYANPPGENRFLVYFTIDKVLPLIGGA